MESLDQRPDAELEAAVPGVRVLLDLADSLDQLQQRMLTFHATSPDGRVHLPSSKSAAGGSERVPESKALPGREQMFAAPNG